MRDVFYQKTHIAGGFNPSEKHSSLVKFDHFPKVRGEKNSVKPPTRHSLAQKIIELGKPQNFTFDKPLTDRPQERQKKQFGRI